MPTDMSQAVSGDIGAIRWTLDSCSTIHSTTLSTYNGTIYYGGMIGRLSKQNVDIILSSCNITCSASSIYSDSAIYLGGYIGYTNATPKLKNCTWQGYNIQTSCNTLTLGGYIGRLASSNSIQVTVTSCITKGTFTTNNPTTQSIGKYVGQTKGAVSINTTNSSEINISVDGDTVSANIGN